MTRLHPDAATICVVGSINLDIVATGEKLPIAGETVTGATLARHPGGKGANQALAARRIGGRTSLIGRVGADDMAKEAMALLKSGGVDLAGVTVDPDAPTGVALIAVSRDGENQIVVAPGANAQLAPKLLTLPETDAVICQLEIPIETVMKAAKKAKGLFAVNLGPAKPVPDELFERADLVIVNEGEAACYGDALDQVKGLVATTYGGNGAVLLHRGEEVARASPPKVKPVDTTGAGDAFVGALVVALAEGLEHQDALALACAAGAIAATRPGAQPSLPTRKEVQDILGW